MIRDLRKRSRLSLLVMVAALIANANAEGSEPAAQKADADTRAKQLPANDEKPLPKGAIFRVGRGHAGQIAGLGLLASAKTLLTSAKDDTLGLWDVESGKTSGRIVAPHSRPKSIAVSPDGTLLTILAPDGKLQMRELPSGKLLREWQAQTTKSTGSVAFSPDGKKVASSGMNTTIWDVATGKPLHQLDHPPEAMSALAFSPRGQILATGSAKGMIRLWDAVTGKELGQLAGHSKYVDQVAFSADEQLLASVSHDDSVRLWRLDTRSELKKFKVEYGVALAFSRDGRSLAAGGGE